MREILSKWFGLSREKPKPEGLTGSICVYLTEAAIHKTATLISSYGDKTKLHEGIVYWAGIRQNTERFVITTVLAPEATTTAGSYKTSAVANAKVIARINDLQIQLLAQVHGHPSSWVGHSDGDNRGAFMPYEGFYSIVVPWYGSKGLLPFEMCGVHQYSNGRFTQLSEDDVCERFIVLPTGVDLRGNYAT